MRMLMSKSSTNEKSPRPRVKLLFAVAVVALTAGITGAAIATSSRALGPAALASGTVPAQGVVKAIGAFRADLHLNAGQMAVVEGLKKTFSHSGREEPGLEGADFGLARSAPIAGTSESVWIVPSGENVCVFIPTGAGGWGGSCPSLEEVASGHGIAIQTDEAQRVGKAIVAVVEPDGASAPSIRGPGSVAPVPLTVTNNVAAAVVPTTDSLLSGATILKLDSLKALK